MKGSPAGRPDTHLVLISDGAGPSSNEDALLASARQLARAGIVLHTVSVGRSDLPTLFLEPLEDRLYGFVDQPVRLQLLLRPQGLAGTPVRLSIIESDGILAHREMIFTENTAEQVASFEITFPEPGLRRCHFRVECDRPIVPQGDEFLDLHITDRPVRLLYIERQPRWAFRLLRNAFQRDQRVEARFVLLDQADDANRPRMDLPIASADWENIDAVILGDVNSRDLTQIQWQGLRNHVTQGGAGLILAAGPEHMPKDFLETPLADLLPFRKLDLAAGEHTRPWSLTPTRGGVGHPIMQLHRPQEPRNIWGRLPTMLWRCPVSELKPAAEVLAEQPGLDGSPGRPAIILQRAGNGLVLFVGTDETWRWRYEVGDRYFHQFWAQATMFVGLPHRTRNQPGFAPDTAPATLPANIEQQDVRARPDLLSRLAGETGGRAVSLAELPELCKELAEAALQEQETSNLLPWDHWLMLVVFAALLCGEWILRKKWHLP